MPKSLCGKPVRSLLLTFALALAQSGLLPAQSLSSLTPAPAEPRPTGTELAAVELPSAPMPTTPASRPEANSAFAAPIAVVPVTVQPQEPVPHRFWDRENSLLFASVGALAAADFCATRANLARGGKELNPLTRVFTGSTPLLATNFALETASVMAVSYLFHKSGHHKLERITSFVSIGTSAAAVGYSTDHR